MAVEPVLTDTSNNPITTISWTTVQRTSQTSTLTYRLWNNHDGSTPAASTLSRIIIYPLYQMSVGEPFLSAGVEPAEGQWLNVRLNGTVVNPRNTSGVDYVSVTTAWYQIGGLSRFVLPVNIPDYYARELEFFLAPKNAGSALSINAMKIVVDWGRGVTSLDVYSADREGRGIVTLMGPGHFKLLGSRELAGFQVKAGKSSNKQVYVEAGHFHLGLAGDGHTVPWESEIITDTAADGALAGTEEYACLLTKNTTGFGGREAFTITKGNKAASGTSVIPASPSLNAIPLATWVKSNGNAISSLTNIAVHAGAYLTADGTGRDAVLGSYLAAEGDAAQADTGQTPLAYAGDGTNYAKLSAQNTQTVDTTALAAGETLIGRIVGTAGNTTSVSQRKVYNARGAYKSRLRTISQTWRGEARDPQNEVSFFGRIALAGVVTGNVIAGTTTQTLPFVQGHRVLVHTTIHNIYGSLALRGSPVNGTMTELSEASGNVQLTVTAFASLAGQTITTSLNGSTTTKSEPGDWTAGVSNNATATSLAAALNGIAGVAAYATGAVVTVIGETAGDTIACWGTGNKAPTGLTIRCSEVHPISKADEWVWSRKRFFGTDTNPPDVIAEGLVNRGTVTVVDYTALAGDTITVTVNGTATVLTAGVQWTAATSNDATATSIASAINAVSGAQAGTAGPVVNVSVAAPGGTLTLASSDGVNLPVATTGLSVTANIYKADLWDNDGKPFAIRSLKCELNPKTPAASVQVRLIKINRSGSYTTVLDSSTKTLLQGNSATAVNNEACAIYLDATSAGTSLATSLDQLPDAACVFPWDQEGIAVLVSGVYDADEIRCSLQYYDLYV